MLLLYYNSGRLCCFKAKEAEKLRELEEEEERQRQWDEEEERRQRQLEREAQEELEVRRQPDGLFS
ncbi:hypothetical protein DPMN_017061 [Dreissena polymorpha]|uniref:Uncharacterized protein n=1 Tax=Dreissena polymorpha TaxID=45954 RepID=A0A9D4NCG2_DREPO|nr:hypothetical protein DPMN_017061 [Dreissena polymorpha]